MEKKNSFRIKQMQPIIRWFEQRFLCFNQTNMPWHDVIATHVQIICCRILYKTPAQSHPMRILYFLTISYRNGCLSVLIFFFLFLFTEFFFKPFFRHFFAFTLLKLYTWLPYQTFSRFFFASLLAQCKCEKVKTAIAYRSHFMCC